MRSRLLVVFVALAVGGLVLFGNTPDAHALSDEVVYHRITFPVMGSVHYSNDWAAPRAGHLHQGNDLMGAKLQPELAAENGVIRWVRDGGSNMLSLRGESGFEYWYIHINNDTPGTDDGLNPPEFILAPGIHEGSKVVAGQFIAYMGDSGDAETTAPHLHFEMHEPDGTPVDPYWSLMLSQGRRVNDRCGFDENPAANPSVGSAPGYWSTTSDGSVYSFGGAPYFGSMGGQALAKPMIGLSTTADRGGYWELSADGGIFSFGNARFHGSLGGNRLNSPVKGMASTRSGAGY
ncbi:MAG: peptidoglycan LD-endopeptidase LytH, partial [Actinomycetota bacterium]|nr:peptidoglycan LD-endopeptidase LytH [Actinomycetota bacterium]